MRRSSSSRENHHVSLIKRGRVVGTYQGKERRDRRDVVYRGTRNGKMHFWAGRKKTSFTGTRLKKKKKEEEERREKKGCGETEKSSRSPLPVNRKKPMRRRSGN